MIKFSNRLVYLLIFLSASIICLAWFSDGLLKAGGESGLPFYDLGRSYELFSSSWSSLGLGTSTGIATAVIPTFKFFTILRDFGVSSLFVEIVFFWLAFSVSGVCIYRLVKYLFPDTPNSISLSLIYFYWFNPIAVANVWNRFLYNNVVFYAFLPLVLYIVLKGLSSRQLIYSVWFGLASLFFSYTFTSMPSIIVLWVLIFLTVIFHMLSTRQFRFPLFFIVSLVLSFSLVNSWWILQILNVYFSPTFGALINESFSNSGNLSTLFVLSGILGKQSNLLALMHQNFYTEGPYWSVIYALPILKLLILSPMVIAFITIYKYRKTRTILFFGALLSLSLYLSKGSANPFGELFNILFTHVSILQIFRNPFEKIGFLLPLSMVPILALGLSSLSFRIKSIPIICLVIFGVYYGFPFWSAQILRTNKYPKDHWDLRSVSVSPNPDYEKISEYLSSHPSSDRLITLPLGGEGIVYNWPHAYWGVELTNSLLPNSSPSYNTSVPYYSGLVAGMSRYQLSQKLFDFAAPLNAKYLFLRGDINYLDSQMANPQTTQQYSDLWEFQNLITPLVRTPQLSLYQINSNLTLPKIFITSQLSFSNSTDLPSVNADFKQSSTASAILETNLSPQVNHSLQFPLSVYPTRNFSSHLSQVKSLSDQDLLAQLLHVEHLPGSKMYPLVILKEKLFEPSSVDVNAVLDYQVGLSGKRAVELYLLSKSSKDSDVQKMSGEQFIKQLKSLEPLVSLDSQPSDYILDSLTYQLELSKRADLGVGTIAADWLDKIGFVPKYQHADAQFDYSVFKFSVPQKAAYQIVYPDQSSNQKIYVNSQSYMSNQELVLDKGDYEIAIPTPLGDKNSYPILPSEFTLANNALQNWNINLNAIPQRYMVSFDVRFVRGNAFSFQVKQDLDLQINQRVEKDPDTHDWRQVQYSFNPRPGASSARISLVPSQENYCVKNNIGISTCHLQDHKFQAEIRNLQLTVYSRDNPRLVAVTSESVPISMSIVTWNQNSPTSYSIDLTKTTSAPELLVFSELFDTRWELFDTATNTKLEAKHNLANLYANGWLIENPGQYRFRLSFTPEDWLRVGKQITILAIMVELGLLILIRLRKNEHS